MPAISADESAYELCIYQIAEGEMDLMQDIFRDLLVPMLPEYSIEGVGYWATPDDATIYYVMRHASLEAGAPNWELLHADPRWTSGLDARGQGREVVTDVQSVPLVGVSELPPATDPADFEDNAGQ